MPLLALSSTSVRDPGAAGDGVCAHVHPHNILGDGPLPGMARDTVCGSGHLATPNPDGTVPPSPATWSSPGWNAFEGVAGELNEQGARNGTTLILRPHARHVLADPQSTLAWLKRSAPSHTRILLDPAAWLTAGMLADAQDHLARTFGAFAGHPAVWGVLLTTLVEAPSGELAPAPLHAPGSPALPAGTLLGALAGFPVDRVPLVVLDEDAGAQREIVERAIGHEVT
ncbi:MAG: hypothetical protein ACF8Q5_09205 [Phycisphaerales bacterium JB040]